MTSNDLVSVVIPAYNHEKYVLQAIESVINQTYGPIELLVLDDGSSDRTWEVINSLKPACEKRFQRVVFNRQKNRGTSWTMQLLLADTVGVYITSMASDDLMAPSLVEESRAFLVDNPDYGAVYFDAGLIDAESRPIFWGRNREVMLNRESAEYLTMADFLRKSRPEVDFRSDDFGSYESLLHGNYCPSASFYRRSLLEQGDLLAEAAPLEDWYMAMQLAKRARLKFIDRPQWSYRWHSANTVTQYEKMKAMARATLLFEIHQVLAADDQATLARIRRSFSRDKTLFDVGGIKLYKTRRLEGKKIVLRLWSREFTFRYQKGLVPADNPH